MKFLVKLINCGLIVLLVGILVACDNGKQEHPNVSYIKSNGLMFRVVKGPLAGAGFFMHDDKGQRTPDLYTAATPFLVNKNSKRQFNIEVNEGGHKNGDLFEFDLQINFSEDDTDNIMRLTGRNSKWRNGTCIDIGEPLSIYIKIAKYGDESPVFEKTESHICAVQHSKNDVYKNITNIRLKPGIYTIYVQNEYYTQAFEKYSLFLLLRQAY